MKISLELSLYPLKEDYEELILLFIARLNQNSKLEVETNGMSTQVFGEMEEVMGTVQEAMKEIYEKDKAMLVMKMGKGTLKS